MSKIIFEGGTDHLIQFYVFNSSFPHGFGGNLGGLRRKH